MALTTSSVAYASRLSELLLKQDWTPVDRLVDVVLAVAERRGQVLVCGNGGSAANALHWATDFLYPMTRGGRPPIAFLALTANTSILTCVANDTSYDEVFSRQVEALGRPGDLLLALSGSGNSPNVIRAIEAARAGKMRTFGIFGYDGGKALPLVDDALHVALDDMQLAEDVQLIACHMVMRRLLEPQAQGSPTS